MSIATNTPLPTLLFAAFATLAMSGCAISLDLGDDATRRTERETVPVAGLSRIDVSTENGQIEVTSGAVDAIELRAELIESDAGDAGYSIETDGDRLVVIGECDAGWWDECGVGFNVVVPAGFDVDIETDNGRVAVHGIAGDVDIETDNGAIDGDRLDATQVRANTDNGRIQLSFDASPRHVETETDNGAIEVRVPAGTDAYDVDADSGNGAVDIGVRTDPGAERSLAAHSDNGSIDIEYRST